MKCIVAVDANWGIGRNGDQLYYIPEDLKRFKELTLGNTIIFGRKTMATFPNGKPLPGRKNVLLSSDSSLASKELDVVCSVEEAVATLPDDTFVVGGGMVYKALLPYCDTVYVTATMKSYPNADTFFPNLDSSDEWYVLSIAGLYDYNGLYYYYAKYKRCNQMKIGE